jgi:TRAP-type C4-dicarboxylate transport system permease small subunit
LGIEDSPGEGYVDDVGGAAATEDAKPGALGTAAYLCGSVGLLAATATDALAVAGRHAGFRLLGSIEIVQAAVVLIASSSMVAATIVGSHASVHIVTERLRALSRSRLARAAAVLSAVMFLMLAIGSLWVLGDLWGGFEQTELLRIPLRWLRLLWVAAALLAVLLFVRKAARREP